MGWSFQQKPPSGWPIDPDHPLSDFVGFWPMWEDSGNQIKDLSGNRNTGTLVADTHWVSGKYGSALDFDGTGDKVTVDYSGSLGNYSQLTLLVWAKDVNPNTKSLLIHEQSNDTIWFTIGTTANKLNIYLGNTTTPGYHNSNSNVIANVWNQLALTYDGATGTFYINGIADGTFSTTGTVDIDSDISFGNHETIAGSAFQGQIGHILIYNRALSASEIALLYTTPFCMFKDPAELIMMASGQVVGAAGIMTTNTGYWGPTF